MAEKNDSGIRMILVLVIISACSGAFLALTRTLTAGSIEAAERAEIQKAIRDVLPAFGNQPDSAENTAEVEVAGATRSIYVARETQSLDGPLVGVAIMGQSNTGYGGPMYIMVGILPDGSVYGSKVLQHTETPGLGSNVRDDPSFLEQFIGRSLKDRSFTWEVGRGEHDIQAITSATITSRAARDAVRDALEVFNAPAVRDRLGLKKEESSFSESYLKVLPFPDDFGGGYVVHSEIVREDGRTRSISEARDGGDRPVGYAIVGQGRGHKGRVEVLVGFLPDGTIHGVFAENPEESQKVFNAEFLDRFKGLSSGQPTRARLRPEGEIDAVSGATGSSRGVAQAVADAMVTFQAARAAMEEIQ